MCCCYGSSAHLVAWSQRDCWSGLMTADSLFRNVDRNFHAIYPGAADAVSKLRTTDRCDCCTFDLVPWQQLLQSDSSRGVISTPYVLLAFELGSFYHAWPSRWLMKSDPRAPLLLKGCYTLETTYAAAINAVLKSRHLIIQKISLEGR